MPSSMRLSLGTIAAGSQNMGTHVQNNVYFALVSLDAFMHGCMHAYMDACFYSATPRGKINVRNDESILGPQIMN